MKNYYELNAESNYTIYPNGDCYSKSSKNLVKRYVNCKTGYCFYQLFIDGKKRSLYIHRLVAINLIPNPENKEFVNHKDFNKKNNSVDNLEWTTRQENSDHSKYNNPNYNKNRSSKYKGIKKEIVSYLQVIKKDCYGNIIKIYDNSIEAAKDNNIPLSSLTGIIGIKRHNVYNMEKIGKNLYNLYKDCILIEEGKTNRYLRNKYKDIDCSSKNFSKLYFRDIYEYGEKIKINVGLEKIA